MEQLFDHAWFMREALKEASKADEIGEIPVGAIVVYENRIIGKGHNLTEQLHDVTAHAEMQAIITTSDFKGQKSSLL